MRTIYLLQNYTMRLLSQHQCSRFERADLNSQVEGVSIDLPVHRVVGIDLLGERVVVGIDGGPGVQGQSEAEHQCQRSHCSAHSLLCSHPS
eukprot:1127751-Rhodomonas_salina.1